jgi:hypothetical protein
MAHFARLNQDNKVEQVVVVDNAVVLFGGLENEQLGINYLQNIFGLDTKWVQTSYNNSFRGKFAGEGDNYDEETDTFEYDLEFQNYIIGKDKINGEYVERPQPIE